MKPAPIPSYEEERLCVVEGLKILDTAAEERFDRITREACERFHVPISTITVIDKDREWFKSVQGLINVKGGARDISFCGHALLSEDILILEDTMKDQRFADNPMVSGPPYIRFYAGKSLYDRDSHLPVGVFCIKDHVPRNMSVSEIDAFLELAKKAEDEINIHP